MPKNAAANKKYSEELGWTPEDFCCPIGCFDETLEANIRDFQSEWDLVEDGICGPVTYRRLLLQQTPQNPSYTVPVNHIVVGGEKKPILWDKVVTFLEDESIRLTGFSKRKRTGKGAIIHWPVTYTPKSTVAVLKRRNISTHFEIGPPERGKVTIYQYVDTVHRAHHCITANHFVGIDVSSPVYAKESVINKLASLRHSPRPVIEGLLINGWHAPPIIGYHEQQIAALTALLAAINVHCGVELSAPMFSGNWKKIRRVPNKEAIVPGVYHHAEVDYLKKQKNGTFKAQGKWDCAGLDLKSITEEAAVLAGGV